MDVDYDEVQRQLVDGLRRLQERGETFGRLAQPLGVTAGAVSNWVNGIGKIPGPKMFAVAKLLGRDIVLVPSGAPAAQLDAAAADLEPAQVEQLAALIEKLARDRVEPRILAAAAGLLGMTTEDLATIGRRGPDLAVAQKTC